MPERNPASSTSDRAGSAPRIISAPRCSSNMAKIDIVTSPTRAAHPPMTDLLAGQTQLQFLEHPTILTNVKAGGEDPRHPSAKRSPALPTCRRSPKPACRVTIHDVVRDLRAPWFGQGRCDQADSRDRESTRRPRPHTALHVASAALAELAGRGSRVTCVTNRAVGEAD